MMWLKIEVYDNYSFLGSFYTNELKKDKIVIEINERFGKSKWTRFGIGN